jgi:NNP family nitrate/nitrite transporter-like MFS transporter
MSEPSSGPNRVLWLSTVAFTLMFAVWLMFGILGKPIREEFGLSEVQLSWIVAAAALNGSLWRLPAGMVTDRIGGRKVMTFLLVATSVPAFLVSRAESYTMLLVLAFLVGFAGNSFSSGIAWNSAWQPREHQGFALGLFGAGNVGASVTKFIGPPLIAGTAGATYFGFIDGGWRLVPVVYAVLLLAMAALIWFGTPRQDRSPGTGQPLREQVRPLRSMRVWRFSLYYVAVFGAYVALAAWLPTYYMDNFDVSLQAAALLTATYIFPASLLRPFGGHLSDLFGARRIMYWTFGAMLLVTGVLMMPNGHIVISHPDGTQSEHLGYTIGLAPFAVLVFLLGCAMGVGKAAVFKHIPEYFPGNVGAVGGLVGMLGGLGGFFLPPLFAYTKAWSGFPSSTFFVLFVLTLTCALWMHWTVVHMLHQESPELAGRLESPSDDRRSAGLAPAPTA